MRNPRTLQEARFDPRDADKKIDRGDDLDDLYAFELKDGFEFASRQSEPVAHERRTIRCYTVAEVIHEFRSISKTGGEA